MEMSRVCKRSFHKQVSNKIAYNKGRGAILLPPLLHAEKHINVWDTTGFRLQKYPTPSPIIHPVSFISCVICTPSR